MNYAEAAYFDRQPVAHVAAWLDWLRLEARAAECRRVAQRGRRYRAFGA